MFKFCLRVHVSLLRAQIHSMQQVKIWNTRLRLMQLVESVRDMAKHGPSKPPAEHGLDEVQYFTTAVDV